jgi:hypothetical protein
MITDKLETNYQIYKQELNKLMRKYNGKLNPLDIVREASSTRSPLHDWFDWEDNSAGEKWRMHQARLLLNSIKVKITFQEGEKEYRKYLNVKVPVNGNNKKFKRFYIETDRIMKNPELKEQVLRRAVKEAEYWQRTYEDYQELEDIFSGIKKAKKKLRKILVTTN